MQVLNIRVYKICMYIVFWKLCNYHHHIFVISKIIIEKEKLDGKIITQTKYYFREHKDIGYLKSYLTYSKSYT